MDTVPKLEGKGTGRSSHAGPAIDTEVTFPIGGPISPVHFSTGRIDQSVVTE